MSELPIQRQGFPQKKSVSTANLINRDVYAKNVPMQQSHSLMSSANNMSSTSLSSSCHSRPQTRMSLGHQQLHNQINLSTLSLNDLHNVPVINPGTFYSSMTPNSSNISLSTLGEVSPSQTDLNENNDIRGSQFFLNKTATLSNLNVSSNRVNLLNQLKPDILGLTQSPPAIELPYGDTTFNYDSTIPLSEYMRCTLSAVPTKASILKQSNIPFALVLKPYTSLYDNKNPVPLCNDGLVINCKRCGSYINPYVKFTPQSNQWRCNFCKLANDLPILYNSDDIKNESDNVNHNTIYKNRTEIKYSIVEYDLEKRTDVEETKINLNLLFIIDVSYNSIKSGMLKKSLETIKQTLDRIPNYDNGTTISFICVNNHLHFFSILSDEVVDKRNSKSSFSMYDVFDIDEAFLPVPEEQLRAPIHGYKKSISTLLESLEKIFTVSQSAQFALGPALETAYLLMQRTGGKIIILGSTLPNIGCGKLKVRRNQNNRANETDTKLRILRPQTTMDCQDIFYKNFAMKCVEVGVSIDQFYSSDGNYLDIATLSNLTKITSGQTHYYTNIKLQDDKFDDVRFSIELYSTLTMDLSLDVLMEVKASHGMKVQTPYGNIFERSPGVYYSPIMARDQSYAFDITLDNDYVSDMAFFQVSILSTQTNGERRLRVMTLPLPTTSSIRELYNKIDQKVVFFYFSRIAVSQMYSNPATSVRNTLSESFKKLISSYSHHVINIHKSKEFQDTFQLPRAIQLLPMLVLALEKCTGFRDQCSDDDRRADFLNIMNTAYLPNLIQMVYPTVYPIHEMEFNQGISKPINNSILNCSTEGIYLLDNSIDLILWIGSSVKSELLTGLFAVDSPEDIVEGLTEIPEISNSPINHKTRDLIEKIREKSQDTLIKYQSLYIFVGDIDDRYHIIPLSKTTDIFQDIVDCITNCMVEDPILNTESYAKYLESLHSVVIK
ncbi:similar to Saccharomyces cerevisiae YIL109C SEC24 Component of the Sec23p-Sec24p heterodimer of the COPII vesicle coat [Maudiozyma saulgeensis]|uniref:Similar to Saccharomyces cerevisiae YIL109C SEC24 Component of the Sec23p-Sec24p heterodimer of the COPII vesicle coat n=1 Tax=Maudiozyma saulgeensis TaxID=1789683 RepID=A0A1X7R4J0_9SACH|nr:similar to Saccharomyces cerevisiae YIL109C SEC24 Component of the Sec23p-Sec24p heterodimer of the COPII vesicle coat [Kazachstania saulgeensis]